MEGLGLIVVYLLTWRLSIVLCGAMCVFLGYRLFVKGFETDRNVIEAKVEGTALKLRNVAPGTCFALFGAALISAMVVTAPAEFTMVTEQAAELAKKTLTVRGDDPTGPSVVNLGRRSGGIVVRSEATTPKAPESPEE